MLFFEVIKLTKCFGGLYAVNDLSFSIKKGEIVGLIGPNGSGKTTTLNMITNTLSPDEGQIISNDQDITGMKPYQIVRKGISRTFQLSTLFMEMTVLDNVLLGFHASRPLFLKSFIRLIYNRKVNKKSLQENAIELLEFTGIANLKKELAKNLPHGHQRCLALSIALATNPKLMLLDEPISGMNDQESDVMMERLCAIRDRGVSILLVEHDMRVVMDICDRIVVLNFGEKIAEDSPDKIQTNKEVIKAYLGETYAAKD
jgi:branched-chain amino acid transport system ATP-binding protein